MKRTLALLCLGLALLAPQNAHAQLNPSFTNILDSTVSLGSGGEAATDFSSPSLRGGVMGFGINFFSPTDGNNYLGVFTAPGGSPLLHVSSQWSGIAPDGGNFDWFGNVGNQGGTVAFSASYGAHTGVFLSTSHGTYTTVAATDQAGLLAPDGNPFASFEESALAGGRIAYRSTYGIKGFGEAIQLNDGGTVTTIADTVAGLQSRTGDPINNLFLHGVSESAVVFKGYYSSGETLFLHTGGALQIAASVDDLLPNGQPLAYIGAAALSGNTIAFIGDHIDTLHSVGYQGIYTYSGGSFTSLLNTEVDRVPDGSSFFNIDSLAVSGSTVAFTADYRDGMERGIFISSGGSLQTLLASGDSLFGSTVQYLELSATGLEGNTLAFSYYLADGRKGVATATFSTSFASAPEPGTLVFLALGGLALVRCRRK